MGSNLSPYIPSVASVTVATKGTYTGDNSANKAIAHGLGRVPKLVVIQKAAAGDIAVIIDGNATISTQVGGSFYSYAVTAVDATNFYVGNATSYPNSFNNGTVTYYWSAC